MKQSTGPIQPRKSSSLKKTDRCELCGSPFNFLKTQQECKRCLRAVCSYCSKERAVVLKVVATERGKHRICDVCKRENLAHKKIRDELKMRFGADSLVAEKWRKLMSPDITQQEVNQMYAQALSDKSGEIIKDYQKTYETQRAGLNFSWYDMLHYVCEKVDKKQQMEMVRKVVQAFLNASPKMQLHKGMIDLACFLLAHCSEANSFYILVKLYQNILPPYLQNRPQEPPIGTELADDVKFITDTLETKYKQGPEIMTTLSTFVSTNYQNVATKFLANNLIWESYFIYFEHMITEQTFEDVKKMLALMCFMSLNAFKTGKSIPPSLVKKTRLVRVRRLLYGRGDGKKRRRKKKAGTGKPGEEDEYETGSDDDGGSDEEEEEFDGEECEGVEPGCDEGGEGGDGAEEEGEQQEEPAGEEIEEPSEKTTPILSRQPSMAEDMRLQMDEAERQFQQMLSAQKDQLQKAQKEADLLKQQQNEELKKANSTLAEMQKQLDQKAFLQAKTEAEFKQMIEEKEEQLKTFQLKLQEQLAQREQQMKEMMEEFQKQQEELQRLLNQKNQDFQKVLQEKQQAEDLLQSSKDNSELTINSQVQGLVNQIAQMRSENDALLHAEQEKQKIEKERMQKLLDEQQAIVDSMKTQLAAITEKFENSELENRQFRSDVEQELEKRYQALQQMQKERDLLSAKIDELINETKSNQSSQEQQLQSKIDKLQQALKEFENKDEEQQILQQQLKAQIQNLLDQLEDSSQSHQNKDKTISQLEKDKQDLIKIHESAVLELQKKLNDFLVEQEAQKQKTAQELRNAYSSIEALKAQLSNSELDLQEEQKKNTQLLSQVSNLEHAIQSQLANQDQTGQQLSQQILELQTLQAQAKENELNLLKQLQGLQGNLDESQLELRNKLRDLQQLQKQLDELINQLEFQVGGLLNSTGSTTPSTGLQTSLSKSRNSDLDSSLSNSNHEPFDENNTQKRIDTVLESVGSKLKQLAKLIKSQEYDRQSQGAFISEIEQLLRLEQEDSEQSDSRQDAIVAKLKEILANLAKLSKELNSSNQKGQSLVQEKNRIFEAIERALGEDVQTENSDLAPEERLENIQKVLQAKLQRLQQTLQMLDTKTTYNEEFFQGLEKQLKQDNSSCTSERQRMDNISNKLQQLVLQLNKFKSDHQQSNQDINSLLDSLENFLPPQNNESKHPDDNQQRIDSLIGNLKSKFDQLNLLKSKSNEAQKLLQSLEEIFKVPANKIASDQVERNQVILEQAQLSQDQLKDLKNNQRKNGLVLSQFLGGLEERLDINEQDEDSTTVSRMNDILSVLSSKLNGQKKLEYEMKLITAQRDQLKDSIENQQGQTSPQREKDLLNEIKMLQQQLKENSGNSQVGDLKSMAKSLEYKSYMRELQDKISKLQDELEDLEKQRNLENQIQRDMTQSLRDNLDGSKLDSLLRMNQMSEQTEDQRQIYSNALKFYQMQLLKLQEIQYEQRQSEKSSKPRGKQSQILRQNSTLNDSDSEEEQFLINVRKSQQPYRVIIERERRD